ncbi:MAG: hypothetical protein D6725_08960, partial [Planctomycetota bacterium]
FGGAAGEFDRLAERRIDSRVAGGAAEDESSGRSSDWIFRPTAVWGAVLAGDVKFRRVRTRGRLR